MSRLVQIENLFFGIIHCMNQGHTHKDFYIYIGMNQTAKIICLEAVAVDFNNLHNVTRGGGL